MNNKLTIVFMLALLAALGCTKDTTPKSTPEKEAGSNFGSLPFVIQDNYTFSLYSQVLTATGYGDTLALNAGPIRCSYPMTMPSPMHIFILAVARITCSMPLTRLRWLMYAA